MGSLRVEKDASCAIASAAQVLPLVNPHCPGDAVLTGRYEDFFRKGEVEVALADLSSAGCKVECCGGVHHSRGIGAKVQHAHSIDRPFGSYDHRIDTIQPGS